MLYLSGFENPSLTQTLTGNRFIGLLDERTIYIAPEDEALFLGFNKKYPVAFFGRVPEVKAGEETEVLATFTFPYTRPDEIRYASYHSDPPGISSALPAVTVNRYGKGTVIWSGAPLEYMGGIEYTDIILSLLKRFAPTDYTFSSDAPENVELTAFLTEDGITLNACLMTEETTAFTIESFTVSVKCEKAPREVLRLLDEKKIPFSFRDGYVTFKIESLLIFDMYKVKYL